MLLKIRTVFFYGVLFFSLWANAQIDSNHVIDFYYGMGVATPLGSLSKQNNKPNDFGKVALGLNIKAGSEFFLNKKNAISLDFDYAFFFPHNDSLVASADRDVTKYGSSFISAGGNDADMIFGFVCLGYSRLFTIGKITLQTKICMGKAVFAYDFNRAYAITSASSFTNPTASSIGGIIYGFNDLYYYTAKPEIGLKYIISRHKYADLILGFNAGYIYAHPKMDFYSSRSTTPVKTLNERLNVLTFNLNIQLVLKKQLFGKMGSLFK